MLGALVQCAACTAVPASPSRASPQPSPLHPCQVQAILRHAPLCPQVFQACLALRDLQHEFPIPYKHSLDEGSVVLTTLSPPSATSPVKMPTTGPNSLSSASSALSTYLTPKAPILAMMSDN